MRVLFVAMVLLSVLSGCAFWEGFERGVTGQDPQSASSLETVGEAAGYAVVDSVVLFPSPWREMVIAAISAVTGWATASRKVDKAK